MGGKTQQRVAGNVKPSSSGRIRELLINKHGAGSIITFSALSNNLQQPPKDDQPTGTKPHNSGEDKPAVESSQSPANAQSISTSDKTTLVVRRVGSRDYFSRIKAPLNSNNQDHFEGSSSSLSTPNEKLDAKKAPSIHHQQLTDASVVASPEQPDKVKADDVEEALNGDLPSGNLAESQSKGQNEVHDFDNILNQLAKIQLSSNPNTTHSLNKLGPQAIGDEQELIKLLNILIKKFKEDLSIEEWDLVNRSIYKWIGLILRSPDQLFDNSVNSRFCVDVFDFIHQLILLALNLKGMENLGENFPMLKSLLDDWDNFSSSKAYHDLIILYFRLAQFDNRGERFLPIIESLANIVIDVDPRVDISNINLLGNSSAKIEFDSEFELPDNIRYCDIDENNFRGFIAISGLLKNNYRVTLVTAHATLQKAMDNICESFKESSVISDQDDIDKLSIAPPAALMSILTSRDSMMSALLSDYRSGDISVTMEPDTDSYTCTLSYLFVWDLVIQFIFGIDKEVGHRIIHCLKKLGLIQRLLDNVFMLLPPLDERDSLKFKVEANDNKNITRDQPWCLSNFLKSPLRTTVSRPTNEIELAALHIYFSVAWHMPVTVRKWFNNNSNKRLCNLVSEYTVKHISQVICSLEMETVQEKCQERANEDKMNNLVIKARPNAKEVYAVYTRDEFRMELTIKLPANYPLGSVQVDGGKRIGVTDLKWRSWLLQLTTFLSHQNGPILDGVDLWRRNIEKKFEGLEKCMICFSILHSNYQLPKKKCQTCSKMFHDSCLYKWFESSGNSTCPLCRNTW